MIDDITADTETIILGYGLCSMGVVGLKATHSMLIIPRQDDCIAIFLAPGVLTEKHLIRSPVLIFYQKAG